VLAALASAMRLAGARVALSRLKAALLLTAPAPTVRLAGARFALSRLRAALLLTPFATAMRDAVGSAASCSPPLGTACPRHARCRRLCRLELT
jgi:hypothetical protein